VECITGGDLEIAPQDSAIDEKFRFVTKCCSCKLHDGPEV